MGGEMWRWAVTPWRGAKVMGLSAGSLGGALLRGVVAWWRGGGGDAGGLVVAAALVIEHDDGADVVTVSREGVSLRVQANAGPTPPPAAATRPAARWAGRDVHQLGRPPLAFMHLGNCAGAGCWCHAAGCGPHGVN